MKCVWCFEKLHGDVIFFAAAHESWSKDTTSISPFPFVIAWLFCDPTEQGLYDQRQQFFFNWLPIIIWLLFSPQYFVFNNLFGRQIKSKLEPWINQITWINGYNKTVLNFSTSIIIKFFVQLVLCLAIRLFNLIESQTSLINSCSITLHNHELIIR